jgi:hypothetical protein
MFIVLLALLAHAGYAAQQPATLLLIDVLCCFVCACCAASMLYGNGSGNA